MEELFGQPYEPLDPYWVIKAYFDIMYDNGLFIKAISYLGKRWGFGTDGAHCDFPDMNSYFREEHFKGVRFSYGYPSSDDSIIVSEDIFCEWLELACFKFLERSPESVKEINGLLVSSLFPREFKVR